MVEKLFHGLFDIDTQHQNADFNGRLISPSAEHLAIIDFTSAIAMLDFAFVQPMPKITNRFTATIKPFQLTVLYSSTQ